jgi:two-component system cell cycle sensor histidine kinase/response regulator CckA
VLGIVRAHKGALRVYSEPGKGTTFKVIFPVAENIIARVDKKPGNGTDSWKGSGTVLLADDDDAIRELGKEMLELTGFHVLTAADGLEALEIYREHHNGIDMVILDMVMPCMNGKEVFLEMRRINTDARIVISSGYKEHDVVSNFAYRGLAGFMQKPYTLEELRECLRTAME